MPQVSKKQVTRMQVLPQDRSCIHSPTKLNDKSFRAATKEPPMSRPTDMMILRVVGVLKTYTSAASVMGIDTRRSTVNMGMDKSLVPMRPAPTLKTWISGSGMTLTKLPKDTSGYVIFPMLFITTSATKVNKHWERPMNRPEGNSSEVNVYLSATWMVTDEKAYDSAAAIRCACEMDGNAVASPGFTWGSKMDSALSCGGGGLRLDAVL